MQSSFKKGDRVRHRLGGPHMMVSGICKALAQGGTVDGINCEWWAGADLKRETFAPEVLTLEDDERPIRHIATR